MSNNLDQLLAKGGQIVGGDLILRHQVMGQFRNGDFFVTEAGLAELEVVDVVEVKEIKKPKKAKEDAPDPALSAAAEGDVTIEV